TVEGRGAAWTAATPGPSSRRRRNCPEGLVTGDAAPAGCGCRSVRSSVSDADLDGLRATVVDLRRLVAELTDLALDAVVARRRDQENDRGGRRTRPVRRIVP